MLELALILFICTSQSHLFSSFFKMCEWMKIHLSARHGGVCLGFLARVGWGEKTSSLRSADFSTGKPRLENTNRKIGRGNIDKRNLNIFLFLMMRQFLNIFSFNYLRTSSLFQDMPHVPFSSVTGHLLVSAPWFLFRNDSLLSSTKNASY